jgi:type IV pilus assembly protein PilV
MRSSGFSLIEVLVAVCVLAIGALGAMSTHALARKSSTSALLQARASALASSVAAHVAAEGTVHYLGVEYDAMHGPPATLALSCESSACSAQQMATDVVYRVQQDLYRSFPAGRLVLCQDGTALPPADWRCDGAPDAPLVIKIGWAGMKEPALSQMIRVPP